MNNLNSTSLILFSALAADANIFVPQALAFPQLVVPQWPIPILNDSLESYCDRIAESLSHHTNVILGGVSFGGIIALHIAERIKPRAVLLIGSVRTPVELPWMVKFLRPLKPFIRWLPFRLSQALLLPFTTKLSRRYAPGLCGFARQIRRSNSDTFKWSLCCVLDWSAEPQVDCPIYQIHGDCDWLLPHKRTQPTTVVNGGGHILTLTHPEIVNQWIRDILIERENAKI